MSEKAASVTKEFPRLGVEVSRAELYRMHWVRGLILPKMADELGISRTSVDRAMRELGVPKMDEERVREISLKNARAENPYRDPDYLLEEYVNKKRATTDIAAEHGVTPQAIRYQLNKHSIPIRGGVYNIPEFTLCYGPYDGNGYSGYPMMKGCDGQQVPVHSLVVIANGADPHEVFANEEMNVDHINGHPADNRPDNLRLIDRTEHGHKDSRRDAYSRRDIESVIRYMLNPPRYLHSNSDSSSTDP